jgi:hypothetical protein
MLSRCVASGTALVLCTITLAGPLATPARAIPSPPNPCSMPVLGSVCDVVGDAAGAAAGAAGEFVMRGVTAWVTDAAVWVTGKVGGLVESTASPDLTASWFESEYGAMAAVAGALALLMLLLAVIQSVIRQDVSLLVRAAFGYLPMAFILSGAAIAATGLLVAITDDLSRAVVGSLGTEQSDNLLRSVGDAYKKALDDSSGIPLFGIFLGAIILAIGGFVLWLEMIIRDAAIYVCVFFLPLTFVAMIWPATGRWARRLVELLVAIIFAKFVVVSILTLASAAIVNTGAAAGDSGTFQQMLAGAALLVLAAWSPFALLRLIPMMELAAASVAGQRSTMGAAAGSAGIQTPAAYMRQAMDRHSRPSTSPSSSGGLRTTSLGGGPSGARPWADDEPSSAGSSRTSRSGGPAAHSSHPPSAGVPGVVTAERRLPSTPPPASSPPDDRPHPPTPPPEDG